MPFTTTKNKVSICFKKQKFACRHFAFFIFSFFLFSLFSFNQIVLAQENTSFPPPEYGECESCACETTCQTSIDGAHSNIREHHTLEFDFLREWFVNDWFFAQDAGFGQMPQALMLLTSQLTATGIQQIQIIGSFLDAKHQLETQRLFQTLTAKAHKDYHPSEGLCEIGTSTMSLAQSERISDLTQSALTERSMDRTLLSRFTLAGGGESSDRVYRMNQFINVFCNPKDNADGLVLLCGNGGNKEQYNMDVDYTSALENKLTLNLDFATPAATADEQNIFALNANLFAHHVNVAIPERFLSDGYGNLRDLMSSQIRQRSIAAKRSVAQNSFSAIAGLRASGSGENAPFLKATIRELGVGVNEINPYIGVNPSYFAQMEVLTKKLYQNPKFYADLYDKPANVDRKGAAMQAIAIMQDRDIYDSLIRSEAVLATLLEALMYDEQVRITRDITAIDDSDERYR